MRGWSPHEVLVALAHLSEVLAAQEPVRHGEGLHDLVSLPLVLPGVAPQGEGGVTMKQAVEHEIKCWPEYFRELESGAKNFEVRFDDRGYNVGDVLHIREWKRVRIVDGKPEGEYTGRELRRTITYTLTGFGIERGYICLGLAA